MNILLSLFSPYITYVGLQKKDSDPHHEMQDYLIDRFEYGRRLNANFLARLSSFTDSKDILDTIFIGNLTYKNCISKLENSLQSIFSDDTQLYIKAIKNWTTQHQILLDQIEIEIESLQLMSKVALKFYIE